jgi:hypothetical protein
MKFDAGARATRKVLGSAFEFRKHGQSGIEVSELLPHISTVVDEITLIRSMHIPGVRNHVPGMRAMTMGRARQGLPGLGNWVVYGLGSESQQLPAFVAINMRGRAGNLPGKPFWLSGYLPSIYQATLINADAGLTDLIPRAPLQGAAQEQFLDLLADLNRAHLAQRPGESDLEARIANYELAARMQLGAKEVMDVSGETAETRRLYGMESPNASTRAYGYHLLVARRLVERGVRFVQVWDYGWDHHAVIFQALRKKCETADQPTAGLILDLKRRGLLDTTLVHWGGEMGRLPVMQTPDKTSVDQTTRENAGRDHNTDGFAMFLAGGGVKAGLIHGATDDFGVAAVENGVNHSDFHATVLHLFGLDPVKLVYQQNGRELTLIDNQSGRVVREILRDG